MGDLPGTGKKNAKQTGTGGVNCTCSYKSKNCRKCKNLAKNRAGRRLIATLEQLLHSGSRRLAALAAPCWDVAIWCLKLLVDLILVGLLAVCFIALYRSYPPKNRRDFVLPSYVQDLE